MTKKPINPNDFCEIMEQLGYEKVHTWYDSHGRSYQIIMQMEAPLSDSAWTVTVYVTDGAMTGFHKALNTDNYLLARRIEDDQKQPGYMQEFRKLDRAVSPCCTALYINYERKIPTFADKRELYRVSAIAGHGTVAFRIKEEDLQG